MLKLYKHFLKVSKTNTALSVACTSLIFLICLDKKKNKKKKSFFTVLPYSDISVFKYLALLKI